MPQSSQFPACYHPSSVRVILTPTPFARENLFYLQEADKFVGIVNSGGDAWTEEFPDKAGCLRWLCGEA